MSSGDITDAGNRLRLIRQHFLAPGTGGPTAERTARATEPAAAMRLAIYDHMRDTVDEATSLAAELCDGTRPNQPRPAATEDVYQWLVNQTAHLDEARQRARDAVIYRQNLQHAILMGDIDVVRPHPCPGCATWGLMWDGDTVRCTNQHCADDDGRPTTWTLAQIAERHVERKTRRALRAT